MSAILPVLGSSTPFDCSQTSAETTWYPLFPAQLRESRTPAAPAVCIHRANSAGYDYKRNGTTTLFAALETLQGKVVGECHERHRHQEFLKFLRRLNTEFPGDDRSGLSEALAYARHGDTVVVWKLDRLGRSLKHLVDTVAGLHSRNVGFQSLQEQIDTTTSGGKLIFHVFAALAEFERDLIRERTSAGLAAARSRGRNGGRPAKLSERQIAMARRLLSDPATRIDDVCRTLRVSRSTIYRHLHHPTTSPP